VADPARRRTSYAEYLAQEEAALDKHEWLEGEIRAMTGGKPVHALLGARVVATLSAAVGPRGCDVYTSDLRVCIPATGLATHPDVTVICGPFQGHPEDPDAATNPVLLVEVLSPSTELLWDRHGKLLRYQQLDSLRTYLLVNTRQQLLEWYSRGEDGGWVYRAAGPGQLARLDEGVEVDVDALYATTSVPAGPVPPLFVREEEQLGYAD